jgi:hypothetical protein
MKTKRVCMDCLRDPSSTILGKHYEINDVVCYTRGSKAVGIEAGACASLR